MVRTVVTGRPKNVIGESRVGVEPHNHRRVGVTAVVRGFGVDATELLGVAAAGATVHWCWCQRCGDHGGVRCYAVPKALIGCHLRGGSGLCSGGGCGCGGGCPFGGAYGFGCCCGNGGGDGEIAEVSRGGRGSGWENAGAAV